MKFAPCRYCGRAVFFARTESGRWIALDSNVPDEERGNVVLLAETNRARVFADFDHADGFIFAHDGDGPFLPHAAACPPVLAARRRALDPKQLGLGETA